MTQKAVSVAIFPRRARLALFIRIIGRMANVEVVKFPTLSLLTMLPVVGESTCQPCHIEAWI